MNLDISLGDLSTIERGLRQEPDYTRHVLEATMHQATLLVQREWQENMPRVSGITARSITSDVASMPAGVLGIVGSSQPSALFIELGTQPHMPPIKAIEPWVKAVLGIREPKEVKRVAFLVARKIAREGTEAQRPMERAALATRGQVIAMFEGAAAQILNFITGGKA